METTTRPPHAPKREPPAYIYTRRPRCPICASVRLLAYRSHHESDGSITRWVRCSASGVRAIPGTYWLAWPRPGGSFVAGGSAASCGFTVCLKLCEDRGRSHPGDRPFHLAPARVRSLQREVLWDTPIVSSRARARAEPPQPDPRRPTRRSSGVRRLPDTLHVRYDRRFWGDWGGAPPRPAVAGDQGVRDQGARVLATRRP